MKKILLAVVVLFFSFTISNRIYSKSCADLQSDLERQMAAANCPKKNKKSDDFTEIDLMGSGWAGTYKFADPNHPEMIMTLTLKGSGSSVSGNTSFPQPDGLSSTNKITGCKET